MTQPLRALFVAFTLAIGSFFASTVYSQYAERAIDQASESIAANAVPSIEQLASARADLRRLETELRHYLRDPEKQRGAVEEARARVDNALDAYLTLPFYPNERELWHDVHHELLKVDQLIVSALAQNPHDQRALTALVEPIRETIASADQTLKTLVDFNARHAADDAAAITRARIRSEHIAFTLDALSALLTLFVAFFALRAIRQFARVLEERNRLQATRALELEQFAGRVAHDVLGPLSATSMALQLAKREAVSDKQETLLERGARGVKRVQTIVDGLLRFARAGAQPEPGVQTEVAHVVEEIVSELQPLAVEQQIELRAEPLPDTQVACNAGVLSSLIENLVRNSIKYMGQQPERRVVVRAQVRSERVRFEVQDTGPGITPDLLPRVFEPYVRGRTEGQPGMGLGLATVRRIVEAHGGIVRVQSSPSGSLFWFELPRPHADLDDTPSPPRASLH